MSDPQKDFKPPPKKYQPRGMTILYEDRDLLVIDKVSGLLSVSYEGGHDDTAYNRLGDYVRRGNSKSQARVFMVHRIDRDTSGVLVFAKTPGARKYLLDAWKGFSKQYSALVHGQLKEKTGIITSYLAEDQKHKMYSVKDSTRGKLAKTGYRTVRESKKFSLLEIDLHTGRKNQIRAHLAEQGHPVVGDNKYGDIENKKSTRLMLHAATLTLTHPHSKKKITFTADTPSAFTDLLTGRVTSRPASRRR